MLCQFWIILRERLSGISQKVQSTQQLGANKNKSTLDSKLLLACRQFSQTGCLWARCHDLRSISPHGYPRIFHNRHPPMQRQTWQASNYNCRIDADRANRSWIVNLGSRKWLIINDYKKKLLTVPGWPQHDFCWCQVDPKMIIAGHQKSFCAQPEDTKNHDGGNLGPHKIIFGEIQGQWKSFRVQLGSNANHVGGHLAPF